VFKFWNNLETWEKCLFCGVGAIAIVAVFVVPGLVAGAGLTAATKNLTANKGKVGNNLSNGWDVPTNNNFASTHYWDRSEVW
jgi:hypothetical protein